MLSVEFQRLRADGRPKRIKTCAFMKVNLYVWTGAGAY